MTELLEPRVFVLAAPGGLPRELPLTQAGAQAAVAAASPGDWPGLTAGLRARGAAAVLVRATAQGTARCWVDAVHTRGWVTPVEGGDIGSDDLLAAWQVHLAAGHVPVDAALLAWPTLPMLSWGDPAGVAITQADVQARAMRATAEPALGLYAIVDTAASLRDVLEAGVRTVQLRVKRPADADAAWTAGLRREVRDSLAAAASYGARLFINDHWRLAAELGAHDVHLGQEDVLALGEQGRAEFRSQCQANGLGLGVSSHAVWELCRARGLAPAYVACGPVWPTTTKNMPWRPQGLDNLAWWCRVAGAPVVAIGGILTPAQVRLAAAAGASGVCVLRGLGNDPRLTVAALQQAFEEGRRTALAQAGQAVALLHPTLGPAA